MMDLGKDAKGEVWVVDDDVEVCALIQRRLVSAGYDATVYKTALEAIEALRGRTPDLILMDVGLPGMDGVEACRVIAAERPDVPVVFVTAHGDVTDLIVGLEAGGRDYVAKPFHTLELLARVKASLREKALREAAVRRAEALERLAVTDPLTGTFNRRYLEARLPDELARAARYGRPLSCLMVDIDNFKAINDNHGHARGDAVIRAVATILTRGLRNVDVVARFGGEEFVVLLPETDRAETIVVGERIRSAVEAAALDELASGVTVSIGIAQGADPDVLVRADRAMYEAKRLGKNRTVAWEPRMGGESD